MKNDQMNAKLREMDGSEFLEASGNETDGSVQ